MARSKEKHSVSLWPHVRERIDRLAEDAEMGRDPFMSQILENHTRVEEDGLTTIFHLDLETDLVVSLDEGEGEVTFNMVRLKSGIKLPLLPEVAMNEVELVAPDLVRQVQFSVWRINQRVEETSP